MATYLELKSQAETLLKQAEELRQQEITEVIRDIKVKMADYGLSVEDLAGSGRKLTSKKPVVVKYRGPNGEEWSGRGRPPVWMTEAEKQGLARENFAAF